jgi:hypothetical protein
VQRSNKNDEYLTFTAPSSAAAAAAAAAADQTIAIKATLMIVVVGSFIIFRSYRAEAK